VVEKLLNDYSLLIACDHTHRSDLHCTQILGAAACTLAVAHATPQSQIAHMQGNALSLQSFQAAMPKRSSCTQLQQTVITITATSTNEDRAKESKLLRAVSCAFSNNGMVAINMPLCGIGQGLLQQLVYCSYQQGVYAAVKLR